MMGKSLLLVGVGGLGGEFLFALHASKYPLSSICLVDPDTISIHTTSRHPLFATPSLIGFSKAESAANWLSKMCPSLQIIFHACTVQEFALSFFAKYDIIVCAVDNLEARRFANCAVLQSGHSGLFLEGGSEGWLGHARCMQFPGCACLECHIDLYHQSELRPMCQGDDSSTETDVIVSAPFVNAALGGIMLALMMNEKKGYLMYNAKTAFMSSVYLKASSECVVCNGNHSIQKDLKTSACGSDALV